MTEISSKVIEGFVELEFLTESEKKKLELVLNRNEKLNKKENARLRKLSSTDTESSLLASSQEFSNSTKSLNSCNAYRINLSDQILENTSKKNNSLEINIIGNCISCGRRFSFLPWSCASPNSNSCNICKSKMCKKCTHHMDRPTIEICKSCHKNILFEAKSGKWFYNNSNKNQKNQENFRSASAIGNDRWISVEKLTSFKKEFGSADHLDNAGNTLQSSISNRNLIPKRKFNNSAYFRIESPNTINSSSETTENTVSPFRRMNKSLKCSNLNSNNYFDTTLKSEDSGCALDMDDETASESALKMSSSTQCGSNSKFYFRPLQISNQINTNNPSSDSTDGFSFSQSRSDVTNTQFNGSNSSSKYVGEVMMSLLYDDNASTVNVTIHKCRNLISVDPRVNCINPYVILFVRPNPLKQGKKKTRTQFSTNNPIFEEYFLINLEIGDDELSQSLILLLCHKNDKTGKDLAIGQLTLTTDDIIHCDQINRWYLFLRMNSVKVSSPDHRSVISRQSDLSQRYRSSNSILPSPLSDCISSSNSDFINSDFTITGEISLALKFVYSTANTKNNNELHLWVKSAKITDFESSSNDKEKSIYAQTKTIDITHYQNYKYMKPKTSKGNRWFSDMLGYQEVVAKSHLFTNHGVYSKEISATKFLENEGYYIWSSIMKFESDLTELKNSTLEISLWIHSNNALLNKILPSKCVGSVYLGLNSELQKLNSVGDKLYHSKSVNEIRLWQAMLNKHNIWIDETLVLKNRKDRF